MVVSANTIGYGGALIIARSLKTNTTLVSLNLSSKFFFFFFYHANANGIILFKLGS